ncbi:MAG TPA: alpha/beta hydrolase [Candidatus Dormibacteraeota bacterium]|nr:alpha/beta hydrolase [Candidatus Dormibacteraeota bacterium]
MSDITHRDIGTNGIRMHTAEAGQGPLVVLLHGFPEGWYSWRHQLAALAEAGFHGVAPDQRGYGQTDRPAEIEKYSMPYLVGDVIGLLDALEEPRAVIVGHDWGAPVAWNTALWRPDRVRGVVGLSVPFRRRGSRPPLDVYREVLGERFYQVYFQEPGVAEREFERDVRQTLRRVLFGLSGDAPTVPDMIIDEHNGFAEAMGPEPAELPAWLSDADLDQFATQFESTGFTGGLNWYRNIDRNWELSAPWRGALVTPAALHMVGDRDVVYRFPGGKEAATNLKTLVPHLTQTIVLPGCGHWIQQERPAEVNGALLEFVQAL